MDYGDLARDRRMLEAFLAAVRQSHSRGMKTNTMAAATLGLR